MKTPGQFIAQHKVDGIKAKRMKKISGAPFKQRESHSGGTRGGAVKQTKSVVHLLRVKALKAIEQLKKKIYNRKLPDLLSLGPAGTKQEKTSEEKLQASRKKLFKDVRKLIHRMIIKNKKALAQQIEGETQQAKYKVGEDSMGQGSNQGSARVQYSNRGGQRAPSKAGESPEGPRRVSGQWAKSPGAEDDGKWANSLDLHQFFNQMKGLPMENRENIRLFNPPAATNPTDPIGPESMTGSPPALTTADLPSPPPGVEEVGAGAPQRMLEQQQNQVEGTANYFNAHAQATAGMLPAVYPQTQMMAGNAASQGAGPSAADPLSVLQLNNPLAAVQPFLSRFYTPSLRFGGADGRFPERGAFAPGLGFDDAGERVPERIRYGSDSIRDQDDDEEGGPVPPQPYLEDEPDDGGPEDDDDGNDADDGEDDDTVPYRRRQKSTIAAPWS